MHKSKDVDHYISVFPADIRKILAELRATIIKASPGAREIISYGMPAYKQNKVLVYFAAHKSHIGFYPTSSGIEKFKNRFASYKWSKGCVQFPLGKALPLKLISDIIKFRTEEDRKKQ